MRHTTTLHFNRVELLILRPMQPCQTPARAYMDLTTHCPRRVRVLLARLPRSGKAVPCAPVPLGTEPVDGVADACARHRRLASLLAPRVHVVHRLPLAEARAEAVGRDERLALRHLPLAEAAFARHRRLLWHWWWRPIIVTCAAAQGVESMQSSAHSIAQSSSRAGTHCKARRSHRAIVIKGGSCVELRRLPTRTLFGRRDRPSRHQLCAAGPSTRSLPCSHDRWLNTVQLGSRRSSAPTVLLLSSASLISSPRSGASAATSLIALVATRGPPFTSIAKGPCLRRSLIDRVRRAHIIVLASSI